MQCKQNHIFLLFFTWWDGYVRKTNVDDEGVRKYKHIVSFNYVENGELVEKIFWKYNVYFFFRQHC